MPQIKPIGTLVIVGGGTAGWIAAAVLARAMAGQIRIHLIESEAIGTVGVGEATIPQIRHLNRFLGFDEWQVLRLSGGTIKLGIRFYDWNRSGNAYIHAFGDIGLPLGPLPFWPYWLRARTLGLAGEIWDYSLNARAAALHRFAPLEDDAASPLAGLKFAYHLDAALYARQLADDAQKRGVVRTEGRVIASECDSESGYLRAVTLEGGQRIEGDFFLDCSGFRALLIAGEMGVGYRDWSEWLPCDRAVVVGSERTEPLHPFTKAMARPAGWQWRIPLQHRTGNGHVYASAHMSDEEAARLLLESLDGKALGEPRILRFTSGMRERVWERNCLALGLAAGFMEPLESTSIHLIQSAVQRLIALFPDARFDPAVIAEYNRQTRREWEQVRDFLILHYHANGRDEPFWRACAAMTIPEALRHKISLFASAGHLFRDGEELFTDVAWLQVLLGQGVEPQGYHPLADALDPDQLAEYLSHIETLISSRVATLPTHTEYVAQYCAAPSS
ncbi:MAG: tryptophan halogenase family protein [Rhodothalassiaceae bacterium]